MLRKILSLAVLLSSSAVFADAALTYDNQGMGDGSSKIYLKDGKMRTGSESDGNYVIFDAASQSFTAVDVGKKQYSVITEETMEKLGNVMNEAMSQMEAQLAQMPEGQREQMRKMMSSMMGNAMPETKSVPKLSIRQTGEKGQSKLGGCKWVQVLKDDQLDSEACLAGAKSLGVDEADLEVFAAMQAFVQTLASHFPMIDQDMMDFSGWDGKSLPVLTRRANGQQEMELLDLSTDDLDPDFFAVPAGFKKQKIMPEGY